MLNTVALKLQYKYVSGTDIYPQIPILRPHAARYVANVFIFHERRISSVTFFVGASLR